MDKSGSWYVFTRKPYIHPIVTAWVETFYEYLQVKPAYFKLPICKNWRNSLHKRVGENWVKVNKGDRKNVNSKK